MKRNFLLWLLVLGFFGLRAQTSISSGELVHGSIGEMANLSKTYEVNLPHLPYTGIIRVDINVYDNEDNLEVIADGAIILRMIKSPKQGYTICTGVDHCQTSPWNWSPREGSAECFPESVALTRYGIGEFLSTGITQAQKVHKVFIRVYNTHQKQTDWTLMLTLNETVPFTIQRGCEFTKVNSEDFISVIQNGGTINLIPGTSIEVPQNASIDIICNIDCLEKITFTLNTPEERTKSEINVTANKVLSGTEVELFLTGENWSWLDEPYQPPHRKEILTSTKTYFATNTCDTVSTTIEVVKMFIPDAFSPNSDGINDTLCVYTEAEMEDFSFRIFNRWGELVFYTNEPMCWDGRYKNSECLPDSYIYVVRMENIQQKGEIILFR